MLIAIFTVDSAQEILIHDKAAHVVRAVRDDETQGYQECDEEHPSMPAPLSFYKRDGGCPRFGRDRNPCSLLLRWIRAMEEVCVNRVVHYLSSYTCTKYEIVRFCLFAHRTE